MKTPLLVCLSLFSVASFGCSKKESSPEKTATASPTLSERAEKAAETTKGAVADAKVAIADKLTEWKLSPADIKSDLEKSGRVVREKTLAAGEKIGGALDNARLVTLINGKLVADKDLSALKINVAADNGVVTLTGTVASPELVGRVIAIALGTEGVGQVVSLLKVE